MVWMILLLIVGFIAWRMMPPRGVTTITTEELATSLKDNPKK